MAVEQQRRPFRERQRDKDCDDGQEEKQDFIAPSVSALISLGRFPRRLDIASAWAACSYVDGFGQDGPCHEGRAQQSSISSAR
jgi:hypothetical protein